MTDYYAGQGCTCYAWSASECGCTGVDWTDPEVYKLRKQLKELQEAACKVLREVDGNDDAFWHMDEAPFECLSEVLKKQEVE